MYTYEACVRLLLRNEFDFWNVHGIMNTSDILKLYVKPFGLHLL